MHFYKVWRFFFFRLDKTPTESLKKLDCFRRPGCSKLTVVYKMSFPLNDSLAKKINQWIIFDLCPSRACFHVTRWNCWVWSSALCLAAARRSCCCRCPIGSDCSFTVKDSWEAPKDGRVPPGIRYSTICSPPPLNRSHANCCTALTFDLRIHMQGHKPTADACGRKSPPYLFFAVFLC